MFILALLLLLGLAPAVSAANPPDRARIEPLDAFSPEVTRAYEYLHEPQTRAERLRSYGILSSAMKSAIWIRQFRLALDEHPEFTDEQRAVLEEAMALFTPELFEISSSSPEWGRRVDAPLQAIAQRARAAFGLTLAAQLFTQLGPTVPHPNPRADGTTLWQPKPLDANAQLRQPFKPSTQDLPHCECSSASDYCAYEFGSDFRCVGGGCIWGVNWGCGTGLQYPCNGLCTPVYNPG